MLVRLSIIKPDIMFMSVHVLALGRENFGNGFVLFVVWCLDLSTLDTSLSL